MGGQSREGILREQDCLSVGVQAIISISPGTGAGANHPGADRQRIRDNRTTSKVSPGETAKVMQNFKTGYETGYKTAAKVMKANECAVCGLLFRFNVCPCGC